MKNLFILLMILTGISSCAPYRQLEDERLKRAQAEREKSDMLSEYTSMKNTLDSVNENKKILAKKINLLEKDTAMANASLRNYLKLDAENKKRMDQLSQTTDRILDANLGENDRLNSKIALQKEDLNKQQVELEKKIAAFEAQKEAYDNAQGKLGVKEQRIQELQAALDRKEQAVKDLQNLVSTALVGFKASGLDVVTRSGKVYVLMPEALLFTSGSKTIDINGREALRQLAAVLNANPEIEISVEGHTDNVPYRPKTKGALVEDNWDLSVLRATSVVKALSTFGVSPFRMSAQGRGEYMPVDPGNSAQARAQNRRTEIILSPKLEQLLKAMN